MEQRPQRDSQFGHVMGDALGKLLDDYRDLDMPSCKDCLTLSQTVTTPVQPDCFDMLFCPQGEPLGRSIMQAYLCQACGAVWYFDSHASRWTPPSYLAK